MNHITTTVTYSESSAKADEREIPFRIDPNLTASQKKVALELLEKYRDVFVSDVSQLRRCNKYPPINIEYDSTKIVRQRNYRMSPDEKEFAEDYTYKSY